MEENLFFTDSRWNNMHAYTDALKDVVRSGGDVVENTIITLSLILEQFPDVVPVDEESHHVQCVHHLVQTVLSALRDDQMKKMGAR